MMNALTQEWELPPFDRITAADFEPAVLDALDEARRNVEAIATDPATPTFANTVEALETASRRLDRISAIMTNLNECCTSDELQNTAMQLEPRITRFSVQTMTDKRLYDRLKQVEIPSDPEKRTLLQNTLQSFERHGVGLPDAEREEYQRNEEELSELKLRFSHNALASQNAFFLNLTDEADLAGLPQDVRTAARDEAKTRGLEGWGFTLAAPSYIPFMTYSKHRHLREKMYRAYGSVGNRGDKYDNNATIARIVALRARQAKLLGFNTYCDYILEDRMVQSLPNLLQFMHGLRDAVLPAARHDLEDVRKHSPFSQPSEFMPWDFAFYSEQLKQQRYHFDSESLRPYFPLDAVREGIFTLYGKLYGVRFNEDSSVPTYHPEVRTYRVSDHRGPLGLLYLDLFPRPSKRSGAWMTEFRGQYGNIRPQIQVVCNFSRPTNDTPSLLRFNEVETFMHEMGHAMHGMLSQVHYESLSGTNVKRDFVEMPSQLMENWCYEPEFLSTFARHYLTGEPLPTEQIETIRAAQNHMAGWLCLRQLNLGFTDIAFHTIPDGSTVGKAEEVEAASMTNLLPRITGCCTSTNFSHIFAGGYASGYYGYKWAEVLDADIFSRFRHDGIFNTQTARAFRDDILAKGGSEHPAVLFRRFMGREPDNTALLKRMNLI